MNARRHRIGATLVACALGALLGACGSGLYDATGVPLLEGGGSVCNETSQVVCGGVCTEEDAAHCGSSCTDCTLGGSIPPGAVAACVRSGGASTCGYECADGLMRCASGCCPATAVAAGERFTCALAEDGTVSCWGANDGGQLGDGTTQARSVPGRVALSGPASAIGTGSAHACAVVGGAVRCWGANDAGQVTGATGARVTAPAATPVTAGAVEVVAGATHTCARLANGSVRCWGAATVIGDEQGDPHVAGATALAAGRSHTCAVVASGAVQCWGANASGQLGNGSTAPSATALPVTVDGVALTGIQHLAAGVAQTCAATENPPLVGGVEAAVRCWGDSLADSLNDGDANDFGFALPQLAPAIPLKSAGQATIDRPATLVAAGAKHVCVSNRNEAIECFGANVRGQLGGTPTGPTEAMTVPLPAAPPAAIATAIAAGADHTCAVVNGGRLRCWGANDAGQLGNGVTTDPGTGSIVTPLGR